MYLFVYFDDIIFTHGDLIERNTKKVNNGVYGERPQTTQIFLRN